MTKFRDCITKNIMSISHRNEIQMRCTLPIFRCVRASLYEVVSVCPSDGWSVRRMDGWMVRPSDGWMVRPFFLNAENDRFSL